LQSQHVIGGDAVGQRMRTAGVLRDIAADGAGALARRIRRVEVALRLDCQRDIQVDDAWLHDGALVREVDFENPVHAREADGDTAGAGNRAAAQARARAAADDGDLVLAGDLDDRHHVLGRARKHYHLRTGFVDTAVVFVQQQVLGPLQISARAEQIREFFPGLGRQHQSRDSTSLSILSLIQSVLLMILRTTLPLASIMYVSGNLSVPYSALILFSGSRAVRKETRALARKSR